MSTVDNTLDVLTGLRRDAWHTRDACRVQAERWRQYQQRDPTATFAEEAETRAAEAETISDVLTRAINALRAASNLY